MDFWGPKIAEDAISRFIAVLLSYTKTSQKSYHKKFITNALYAFGLPHPSETYFKYASKELSILTVHGLIDQLYRSPYVTNDMLKKVSQVRKDSGLTATGKSSGWYRFRTFEDNGIYPDRNFIKDKSAYLVIRGQPFIITLNSHKQEERSAGGYNENSVLTRNEVKLLSSLMCSQYWGTRFSLIDDIHSSRIIDISQSLLDHVDFIDLPTVLVDYAVLTGNSRFVTSEKFSFVGHDVAYHEAGKYFNGFKINDTLLLRTCFLQIKAASMYGSPNYYEDAVSNIFVSLEGAFVMLQRNDVIQYDRIIRSFHRKKFQNIFTKYADSIYDFVMEEVFDFGEKRASLVHPQAATDWTWVPNLSHEDYKDYRDILKQLIYYGVLNETQRDPYEDIALN